MNTINKKKGQEDFTIGCLFLILVLLAIIGSGYSLEYSLQYIKTWTTGEPCDITGLKKCLCYVPGFVLGEIAIPTALICYIFDPAEIN